MGNELVSDLLPDMGAEIDSLAPLAYTKTIYNHFPYYLSIGMTEQQYFDGDSCLVIHYRQADKIRKQRQNEFAWIQGMYIYDAILSTSPALRAIGGSEPIPYREEPYPITQEEIEKAEEKRRVATFEAKKAEMIAKAAAINRNFKEKDGEANGGN